MSHTCCCLRTSLYHCFLADTACSQPASTVGYDNKLGLVLCVMVSRILSTLRCLAGLFGYAYTTSGESPYTMDNAAALIKRAHELSVRHLDISDVSGILQLRVPSALQGGPELRLLQPIKLILDHAA